MDVGIVRDWVWYVPDYKDNREQKEENQIQIEILPLDHKEKIKWGKKVKTFLPGGMRPGRKYAEETNAVAVSQEMFCNHTREVKNCEVLGQTITSGKDLYEADGVDSELINDIREAISEYSTLKQGLVKNS